MFYDHFDKLPPIIDDANQETYFAVTSTKAFQDSEEAVVDKLKHIPNMNLIPETLIRSRLNIYYCGLCGFAVIVSTQKLEKMSKRRLDYSIVFDLQKMKKENKNLILKYFLGQGILRLLIIIFFVFKR